MTVEQLQKLLNDLWHREISADEAWEMIDADREAPSEYSKEYWLPIKESA